MGFLRIAIQTFQFFPFIFRMAIEGYNLDAILKKKKRNLYNRMTAAAGRLDLCKLQSVHGDIK